MFNTKKFWAGALFGAATWFLTYLAFSVYAVMYIINNSPCSTFGHKWPLPPV